jgi:hypothetical protein
MGNRASSTMSAVALSALLLACGGSDSSSETPLGGGTGGLDYDGSWLVTVHVTSCYDFTGSATVTVTDGVFADTLFTFCANPRSGDTYAPVSGCGTDIVQTVSIEDGLFSGREVEGNLFLAGGACNGGNGFWGTTASTSAATASSYWGSLTFAKQ